MKALVGMSPEGKPTPIELGHSFMAIKIENFVELAAFKKQIGDILRQLRASKKAPGAERIWTPGEKEYEIWLYRKDKGVPFNEPLKAAFRTVKEKLGLPHKLPF